LITRAFAHLHSAGVRRFVVNTHWQAHAYHTAFPDSRWNGCPLTFSHESPEVLETAGGLQHAASHLPEHEPFWVYNGDILSSLPLASAWAAHREAKHEITLVLRSSGGPLHILRDHASGRVLDIGRRLHPDREPHHLFTGIYLVEPAFLARIPVATKISVIPIFMEMIRQNARLGSVVVDEGEWWDLGSREQILGVHSHLSQTPRSHAAGENNPFKLQPTPSNGPWIAPTASVAPDAWLSPSTAVGEGCHIGEGASLTDCVIWENARIAPGARLLRCIVTAGTTVSGTHTDADL
jgi:NDP-sugar pyrophosphorylase family protein